MKKQDSLAEVPSLVPPSPLKDGKAAEPLIEYEQRRKDAQAEIEKDPHKVLVQIPIDDVTVEVTRRTNVSGPAISDKESISPVVQRCLEFYNTDSWLTVRRKYERYSLDHGGNAGINRANAIAAHEYEVDTKLETRSRQNSIETKRTLTSAPNSPTANSRQSPTSSEDVVVDATALEFLNYTPGKTEAAINAERQNDRNELAEVYVDMQLRHDVLQREGTYEGTPFGKTNQRALRITVEKLHFDFFNGEPCFVTMALYDVSAQKRISENHYFTLHIGRYSSFLPTHVAGAENIDHGATFSVTYANEDIYLILRLEKVLEGDISGLQEKYANVKGKPPSEESIRDQCRRLGRYRQPFAWASVPIFPSGSMLHSREVSIETRMGPIFKLEDDKMSDTELCSMTHQLQKGQNKKSKSIPGSVSITVEDLSPNVFSSRENQDEEITTLTEFPQNPTYYPHTSFINDIFVYPLNINLSRINHGRNIWCKVQVCSKADLQSTSIQKAIRPKFSNSKNFVDFADTAVTYHSKNTDYYEEVRVSLPHTLSDVDGYHLLFTFYHIACKDRKDKETQTEIGRAFLPVTDSGTLINGIYNIPVAQTLCNNYLNKEVQEIIKWLDNRRPIFSVSVKAYSSVLPQDHKILNFLKMSKSLNGESINDQSVIQTVGELADAAEEELSNYCPVLLDTLFDMLSHSVSNETGQAVFNAILALVQTMTCKIPQPTGMNTIKSYVKSHFRNNPRRPRSVHEEVLKQWAASPKDGDSPSRTTHAWFLFEIVTKSILGHQSAKNSTISKKSLLSSSSINNLQILVKSCSEEVTSLAKTALGTARRLNASLAYFLTDCFRFLDTSLVFELLYRHVALFDPYDHESIINLKFDFLTIVCNYEHFVPLNLPLASYMNMQIPKTSLTLIEYWRRHFLIGIVLNETKKSSKHSNDVVRLHGIRILKHLLMKLMTDDRYADPHKRQRIAAMFWPFVLIACDHVPRLAETSEKTELEKRTFLYCFLQILQHLPKSMLMNWLRKDDSPRHQAFYDLLRLCLVAFEYTGKTHARERLMTQSTFTVTQDTKRIFEELYARKPVAQVSTVKLFSDKKGFSQRPSHTKAGTVSSFKSWASGNGGSATNLAPTSNTNPAWSPDSVDIDIRAAAKLVGVLGSEVTLTVLDVIEVITDDLILSVGSNKITDKTAAGIEMQRLFNVYTTILELSQSKIALVNAFNSLKSFIHRFSSYIFETQLPLCSELCRLVLKHCESTCSEIQQLSCALLYMLMKRNYNERNGNISKVRIQTSVALSKLDIKDDKVLSRAFCLTKNYAERDKSGTSRLKQLVAEFMGLLASLARDNAKINMYNYDPEMVADMYYRIATSYIGNSPDLRLANLEALANIHSAKENDSEAAFCTLQGCKLVSDYLIVTKRIDHEDFNAATLWRKCCPNVDIREITDNSILAEEGVCQSHAFSELGLLESFEKTCKLLIKAHMLENACQCYKFLLFFYEKRRDFAACARSHGQLKELYEKISDPSTSAKRIAGTYFRVAFFGPLLEALDGQEFVYREKPYTSLAEVCDRISACYRTKFGEAFKLLQESGKIDRSALSPEKVYIQITACEPFYSTEEAALRQTPFERSTNVSQFVFETPYTPSGKAHGSVADQHKRKTVLTTERAFPDLKRRLLVVSKREFELTPIEVAIEAMHDRCRKLNVAISVPNPEAKGVQLLLQGSVRLQVNSGPMEYARSFLDEKNRCKYRPQLVNRLVVEFREFLRLCERALILNRQKLIKADQLQYQEDLEEGYEVLKRDLEPYLKEMEVPASSGASETQNASEILTFIQNDSRKVSKTDESILKTFFGFL